MAKLPPLEPRVGGASYEYSPRPSSSIALAPSDYHSNGASRDFGPGLPYARDDGARFYALNQAHAAHHPLSRFYPQPPTGPPRAVEPKFTSPPSRYILPQSPSSQHSERPTPTRGLEPRPSPPVPYPDASPWIGKGGSPSSIKVESSVRPSNTPPVVPPSVELSEAAFTEVLRKYQEIVRDEHDYSVKTLLVQARAASTLSQAPLTSPGVYKSPKKFGLASKIHSSSPFSELKSIEVDRSKPDPRKRPVKRIAQWHAKASKAIPARSYVLDTYQDPTRALPVYGHYTSLKHNMLVEDDNHRTFYTSFGDDPDDDSDTDMKTGEGNGDIKDQEDIIAQNQKVWHKLNSMTERAIPYIPFVEDLLAELGCDVPSVLKYLVDDLSSVPAGLPQELEPIWKSRDQHLNKEGFYEDEDNPAGKRPLRRWMTILERLSQTEKPSDKKRAAAGIAFVFFSKQIGFSFWHVVRVSHLTQDTAFNEQRFANETPHTEPKAPEDRSVLELHTYTDLACLACRGHECPGHGEWEDIRTRFIVDQTTRNLGNADGVTSGTEIRSPRRIESSNSLLGLNEDGTVTGIELDYVEQYDSFMPDDQCCSENCFWRKRNRVNSRLEEKSSWSNEESQRFDMLYPVYYTNRRGACMLAGTKILKKSCAAIFERMIAKGPAINIPYTVTRKQGGEPRNGVRRPPGYWQDNYRGTSSLHLRQPFVPCNHPGPCNQTTDCDCWRAGVTCEYVCNCPDECQRRYPGCTCHSRANKKLCQTNACECYQLNRECHPDLCHGCHADEVLDPANRYNEKILDGKCHNVMVQRGVPKRTLIGVSKLLHDGGKHGFGLYMGESCSRGDFIGEYVGELVSDSEAGRRGAVYDKIEMSYLFDLNKEQTLDSMTFGNKTRFINDQDERQANCAARVLLCNMVTRIGMFAKKDINVGDELFFDYGLGFRKRFDLIKRNDHGEAVIEKRNKLKSNPKQGKAKLKSPAYSKNGRRIGRPPKNPAVPSPPPTIATGSVTVSSGAAAAAAIASSPTPTRVPAGTSGVLPRPHLPAVNAAISAAAAAAAAAKAPAAPTSKNIPFRGTSRKRRRSETSEDEREDDGVGPDDVIALDPPSRGSSEAMTSPSVSSAAEDEADEADEDGDSESDYDPHSDSTPQDDRASEARRTPRRHRPPYT